VALCCQASKFLNANPVRRHTRLSGVQYHTIFFLTKLRVTIQRSVAYTFQNLSSGKTLIIDDEPWLKLLALAGENGWEEEGTRYDFAFQVDEEWDFMYGYEYNLWLLLQTAREMFEWEGGYIEKKNQIVYESDAYFMAQALEKARPDEDRPLLDFLRSGSFRILAD